MSENASSRRRISNSQKISTKRTIDIESFENIPKDVGQMRMEKLAQLNLQYKFPASKKVAEVHKQAQIFGKRLHGTISNGYQKCPCCDKVLRVKEQNPFSYELKEITDETFEYDRVKSVILFFEYIKFLISMVLLRFAISGAYGFWSNYYVGDFCEDCSLDFWCQASSLHKYGLEDEVTISNLLAFVVIPVFYICSWILKRSIYYKNEIIDMKMTTDDDFNLFVKNIPLFQVSEEGQGQLKVELKQFLNRIVLNELGVEQKPHNLRRATSLTSIQGQQSKRKSMKNNTLINNQEVEYKIVEDIILCYDITSIQRIRELRNDVMQKINSQIKQNPNYGQQHVGQICSAINEINELQVNQCYRFASANLNSEFFFTYFVGKAFVTFSREAYKQIVMKKYYENGFNFKDSKLMMIQPGHPSDINWENLKFSKVRKGRIFITYIILFVFLIFCFAILSVADKVRMDIIRDSLNQVHKLSSFMNTFVNSITTVVTMFINLLLSGFCDKLTQWECHETKSKHKQHLILKLVVTQFANTALLYWLLAVYAHEDMVGLLHHEGLVNQVCNLIIVSGAIQLGVNYFNIGDMARRLKKWLYYRRLNNYDQIYQFQETVNNIEKYNQFDIAQRYAYYIVQIYTLSFYAYLVPICDLAVGVLLIANYWADKINLISRSSFNCQFSYELTRIILILSQNSICVYAAGVVIFSSYSYSVGFLNIIGLIVAFVLANFWTFLPKKYDRKINMVNINSNSKEQYSNLNLNETYRKSNPATFLLPPHIK